MTLIAETVKTSKRRNVCDGASEIPGGVALGHPRVWLEIDEKGYVDCGYCDRRFILIGGPADVTAIAADAAGVGELSKPA
ncbi:zinc-finger domain-containing protein [Parasphingorhabdus sp. JC815]|uniref:zinc-finger domain-containing protein n=1 Tax=Parasphingorhabdus sp. JC815 TaxID=3232140 RepID=UPI0034589028